MSNPEFTIVKNVPIPPRTIPTAGPRGSKYPIDSMEEGDCFPLEVKDRKEGQQKQSQFSGLAKTRGIKLITRYYSGEEGNEPPFEGVTAPCLGVWHGGPAEVKTKDDANADTEAGEASDASDEQAGDGFEVEL